MNTPRFPDQDETVVESLHPVHGWREVATYTTPDRNARALEDLKTLTRDLPERTHRVRQHTTLQVLGPPEEVGLYLDTPGDESAPERFHQWAEAEAADPEFFPAEPHPERFGVEWIKAERARRRPTPERFAEWAQALRQKDRWDTGPLPEGLQDGVSMMQLITYALSHDEDLAVVTFRELADKVLAERLASQRPPSPRTEGFLRSGPRGPGTQTPYTVE